MQNIITYNTYMDNLGNLVPESIDVGAKKVLRFRDGLEYSFVNYVQSLGRVTRLHQRRARVRQHDLEHQRAPM